MAELLKDWKGKNILIAEDASSNYLLLEATLKYTNATFDWVTNGIDAVERFREKHYDLILMDVKMPHMNGIDATIAIKKENPTLPIIIISAFALKAEEQEILKSGCDMFLTKPLSIDDLLDSISNFLD